MAFKSRQEETKPAESRTWAEKEEPPKEAAKPAYDGPILVSGLLDGKTAVAWGKTYKAIDEVTDKGRVIIPEGTTFLVLNSKKEGAKNPYNLFIVRKEQEKR